MAQDEIVQNGVTPFEEEKSNFDIVEWIFRILHYWYLFVIAGAIALSLAYLKNRRVIERYLTTGTMIIKESSGNGYGSASIMQGFGVGAGYTNVNNQLIILGSYDLIARTVDSLPFLNVEYITKGRFKTRNIYRNSPISVEYTRVEPMAYQHLFRCTVQDDGSLLINTFDEKFAFSYITHYGEELETSLFTARIWPTNMMLSPGQHIYFRFRSRESLTDEFSSRLQLNFLTERSTVLGIQLIGETPERDREFINKLSDIYLLQNVERKNMVAEKSIAFINNQLEILQTSLTQSEGAMTNFRQENKFVDVNSYAGGLMSKVNQYDQQQMALRLKETYLDYLSDYLDQKIDQGSVIAPATLGLNEPMLMQLVQQLNDLHIQRGELSQKNVYYAKYTSDINNVKSAIAEVVRSMSTSLEIEKKDLNVRMREVEREIQSLPEKELQMVAIERNYRIDDNYYTFFLQKRAEAEIQKAGNTPDSEIMDRARTTRSMNSKEKRKNTMTYLAIGLLIPLLILILSELLNNKVRTPKEAEKLSSFDLLGSLRHVKSQNPTYAKKKPRSSYAEALRSIRMRIEFKVLRKTNITITVTSTQSGDGKTFISTNLASLYSMTGHPTVIIDMDIRKPNVHDKLGLAASVGVTNYLIGDCQIDDIILHNEELGFDVIPAGTIPPNPGELIRSEKLAELFALLRQRYTYLIVDSSPVGIVPDAMALIEQTDITLYVVRCMATDKHFAKQTLDTLSLHHKEKINLLLSDIPIKSSGKGYGYGYGYGSSYGYGYGYGYGAGYGYGYGAGYGYGYGQKGKKHRYGVDYIRTKLSKKSADAPHQYIDDEEDA
jgi:capsular exopolysaccharide synthesis family protein